jgi:hypothetical protein
VRAIIFPGKRIPETFLLTTIGCGRACGSKKPLIRIRGESGDQIRAGQARAANVYEFPLIETAARTQAAEESLNRQTREDDTQPSPNDGLRLTRKITS